MIKFEKVSKNFGSGLTAIKDLDLSIDKGEFVFITGPSGAGKTTMLRLLTKQITPTSGKIFFKDKDISLLKNNQTPQLRRKIGAVFQDFKLLNDRTVEENVRLGLEILGKEEKEIDQKVKQVLGFVGLNHKESFFPKQLAGGELQRVALARVIAMEPEVLFADEPTGNLDPTTAWQVVEILEKINKSGMTLIMATHNFDIVDSLGKRVIRMEKGKKVSDEKKGKYKK